MWREATWLADRIAHTLQVAGSTVIVTSSDSMCGVEGGESDGLILAFDLATGWQLWQRWDDTQWERVDALTGEPRGSWPASWTPLTSYGDWLFVGDNSDWSLTAVRVSTLAVAWSMDRISNRAATDGRRLYLGIGTGLEAYDVATGKKAWAVDLGGCTGQPLRLYGTLGSRRIGVFAP